MCNLHDPKNLYKDTVNNGKTIRHIKFEVMTVGGRGSYAVVVRDGKNFKNFAIYHPNPVQKEKQTKKMTDWEEEKINKIKEDETFISGHNENSVRYKGEAWVGNRWNHLSGKDPNHMFEIIIDKEYENMDEAAIAAANNIKKAMTEEWGSPYSEYSITIYQCQNCKKFYLSTRRQGTTESVHCDAENHNNIEYKNHPMLGNITFRYVAYIHSHPNYEGRNRYSHEFSIDDYGVTYRSWEKRENPAPIAYLLALVNGRRWALLKLSQPEGSVLNYLAKMSEESLSYSEYGISSDSDNEIPTSYDQVKFTCTYIRTATTAINLVVEHQLLLVTDLENPQEWNIICESPLVWNIAELNKWKKKIRNYCKYLERVNAERECISCDSCLTNCTLVTGKSTPTYYYMDVYPIYSGVSKTLQKKL